MAPFAKIGGLGDVCAALPRHLHRRGHDVRPFLPLYGGPGEARAAVEPVGFARDMRIRAGGRTFTCSLWTGALPGGGPQVHFVECPALFGRPGVYSAEGDEHLRFSVITRASVEGCQRMGFAPDVFHAHDWHAALLPLYLKTVYGWDRLFRDTRTVLTIHNLGYQGVFPSSALPDLALEGAADRLDRGDLEAGRVGFLKTGILHADAVTTVSATYAREILGAELGMGLDPWLRARQGSLVGITNGIDAAEWDPATDPYLPAHFSAGDVAGKGACRARLLEEVGLVPDPAGPVFGVVSRFTAQKGFDLLFGTLPPLLASEDARLVALGSGESRYEEFFAGLAHRLPGRVAWHGGHREELAHRIEAGADLFLMPSRFEPCGLNQMFSMRYGTLPVVRRTGGLADTVEPWNPATGEGTGFVFDHFTGTGLRWALDVALQAWRDRPAWDRLVRNAMARDFSWDRRVREYEDLFARLAG